MSFEFLRIKITPNAKNIYVYTIRPYENESVLKVKRIISFFLRFGNRIVLNIVRSLKDSVFAHPFYSIKQGLTYYRERFIQMQISMNKHLSSILRNNLVKF